MKRVLMLAALAGSLLATTAAAENNVVKCKTWQARRAAPVAGPALVANVPKSMTPIDLNAVQFTDKPLTRQVLVEGLFARRTETDTVEVTARFVNCTDKPLQVQARSSFMDMSQAPTEPVSAWTQVFIPPKGTGTYRERSMSRDEVQYYLIELAPGR
ncbi:MAG: hypothetical protein QM795_05185 [Pseudoxanthomonas sp.]